MGNVPLDGAQFVGIVLETVLYGVFLILFIGAMYVLVINRLGSRGPRREINWILLNTAILLFTIATAHWVVELSRSFDAFIRFRDEPGGPAAYYGDLANTKNVVQSALYILQTLAGDIFMIYRVYLVWGRNGGIIIIPALLTVTMLSGGIGTVVSFSHFVGTTIFVTKTKKFLTTAFSATLAMNVLFLIAYKVLIDSRKVKGHVHGRMYSVPVVEIVVESAAILCCCIISTMVAYVMNSNVQYAGVNVNVQVIGISWTLIIVRVGLGYKIGSSRSTGVTSLPGHSYRMNAMPHVAIRVSNQTETDYNGNNSFSSPMKPNFTIPPVPNNDYEIRSKDDSNFAMTTASDHPSFTTS